MELTSWIVTGATAGSATERGPDRPRDWTPASGPEGPGYRRVVARRDAGALAEDVQALVQLVGLAGHLAEEWAEGSHHRTVEIVDTGLLAVLDYPTPVTTRPTVFCRPDLIVDVEDSAEHVARRLEAIERQSTRRRSEDDEAPTAFAELLRCFDDLHREHRQTVRRLADDIADLESRVFDRSSGEDVEVAEIYGLKRVLIGSRYSLDPVLNSLGVVLADESSEFPSITHRRFTRMGRRLEQIRSELMSRQQVLDDILSAQLTLLYDRQNDTQRALSGWAAVAVVPTLIFALSSTTFPDLPGGHDRRGLVLVLACVVAGCGGMWFNFRKRRWL